MMYSKEEQLKRNRIKLTQKQKGDISQKVREEVKERSNNICEICLRKKAVHLAHITSRKRIEHRTTANDLLHSCIECHYWLDNTKEGKEYKEKRKYNE